MNTQILCNKTYRTAVYFHSGKVLRIHWLTSLYRDVNKKDQIIIKTLNFVRPHRIGGRQ